MKGLNSTIVRSILLIILLIMFWVWAGLSFSDRINVHFYHQDIKSIISESIERGLKLENQTNQIIETASPGIQNRESLYIGELEQNIFGLVTNLDLLLEDEVFNNDLSFKRKINIIKENSEEIIRISNEYIALVKEKGDLKNGLIYTISQEIENEDVFLSVFSDYLQSFNPESIENMIDLLSPRNPDPLSTPADQETSLDPLKESLTELLNTDYRLGYYLKNGLTGNLKMFSDQVSTQLSTLSEDYKEYSTGFLKSYHRKFILLMILFSLLIISAIIYTVNQNLKNLEGIRNPLSNLGQGKLPDEIPQRASLEFEEIYQLIKTIVENLRKKVSFAKSIAKAEELDSDIRFSENDELGNEMIKMAEKIRESRKEDILHAEVERKRRWHSEGLASFGEIFRSERENLEELAFKVIKKLVNYLNASQGTLLIMNDEEEEVFLEVIATYAFDRRKYFQKRIKPGEGLAGTCALEKETIYVNEVPDDYIFITSGLGETSPHSLLVVPLKLENEIFGILEIASLSEIQDYEIEFVEHLAESIATTLAAVKINKRTAKLLEQSQLQAEDMKKQEEEMKKNVAALERAQDESKRKEHEITGILNAVNASSLVAEFSLNGRVSEINDKFLELMETTKDQVIGKHHSEFAEVDKYSESYKQFWRDLRNGKLIFQTEKFKLYSGKEIWLNQTYTSIQDKDGNTVNILNIAHDITQIRLQQTSLEQQANQIIRKSSEMNSLSEAIDQSIIKCEYSPEGIIMDTNDNYCKITGLSSTELLGKNTRLYLKEDEKKQFDTILNEVIKDKPYTGVVKRSKPTGEEIWLMANFTPVKDEDNKIFKIYFLAQDITEKKLKYQLLEEANKEIDRLREENESLRKL